MDAAVVVVATSKTSRRRVLPRAKVVGALRSSGFVFLDPSCSSFGRNHRNRILNAFFFVPPLDKGVFRESARESGERHARTTTSSLAQTTATKKRVVCVFFFDVVGIVFW